MSMTFTARVAWCAAAAAIGAASLLPSPFAQTRPTGRVVAIGDVHGSLDGLRAILRATGLTDASDAWTGGATTLVQTGDTTDRGADVRGVLDLVRRLEAQAPKSGGRVVALLGNHEVMNAIGEIRDVTPAICASFAGRDAEAVRDRGWKDYTALVRARARARPGEQPLGLARTEEAWRQAYHAGCIEYRRAMGPQGDYGRWLRRLPIAARIGRSVFMHAGAPPGTTATLEDVVAQAKGEIERYDRLVDRLSRARLIQPWFRLEDVLSVAAAEVRWLNSRLEQAKAAGAPPDLQGIDVELVALSADVLQIGGWSLLKADGPLWYRGYSADDDAALDGPATAFLQRWDVDRLVVGHTVQRDFRIRARVSGRVFLIDTGMLAPVYKGSASALEIDGASAHAIYADGTRVKLSPPTAP
jgi:Calcineurin-like phosphoesterase